MILVGQWYDLLQCFAICHHEVSCLGKEGQGHEHVLSGLPFKDLPHCHMRLLLPTYLVAKLSLFDPVQIVTFLTSWTWALCIILWKVHLGL